jgi:hypothetical protein
VSESKSNKINKADIEKKDYTITWEDALSRILQMKDVPSRASIDTPEWIRFASATCSTWSPKDYKTEGDDRLFPHRSTMTVTNKHQQAGDNGMATSEHVKAWTYVKVAIPYVPGDASKQYDTWIKLDPPNDEIDPRKTQEAYDALKDIGILAENIWVHADQAIKDVDSDKSEFKGSAAQAYAADLNRIKYAFANIAFRISHTADRDPHGWVGSNWLKTLEDLKLAQESFFNTVKDCRDKLLKATYHDPKVIIQKVLDQLETQVKADESRWSTNKPAEGWNVTVTAPSDAPEGTKTKSVTVDLTGSDGWRQVDGLIKEVWRATVRECCDDRISKSVVTLRTAIEAAYSSFSSLTPPGFTPTSKYDNGSGTGGGGDDPATLLNKILNGNNNPRGGGGLPPLGDKDLGDSGDDTGPGKTGPGKLPPLGDKDLGNPFGDSTAGKKSPSGVGIIGDIDLGDSSADDSAGKPVTNPWDHIADTYPGSWTSSNTGPGTDSLGSKKYYESNLGDSTDGDDGPSASLFPTSLGGDVGLPADLDLGGQDSGGPSPLEGFDPGSDVFADRDLGLGDLGREGGALGTGAAMSGGYGGMPMSPMGGMGGMGGGGSQQEKERERTVWVEEEEDVWGTDPDCAPAVIGRFDDAPSGADQHRPTHQPSRRPQPGQSPTRHQVRGRG